jgi:hypothetical protein
MPNVTIYVPDDGTWLQAKRMASAQNLSMSSLVHQLLLKWIAAQRPVADKD